MTKPWFRPKKLGVGAVPASWQGWAMTGALIAVVLGLALHFEGRAFPVDGGVVLGPLLTWGALTIAVVVAYMVVAWQRSSEPWHWRWEKD